MQVVVPIFNIMIIILDIPDAISGSQDGDDELTAASRASSLTLCCPSDRPTPLPFTLRFYILHKFHHASCTP